MIGMNWAALAPVPMTATRLPVRSTSWSHSAEWNAGPANDDRPAMSGSFGLLSWPVALITASKVAVSDRPDWSTVQILHVAE